METAGFYQYSADETYVLLSFGEVGGIVMNVTPRADSTSVYFSISSTPVSDIDVLFGHNGR